MREGACRTDVIVVMASHLVLQNRLKANQRRNVVPTGMCLFAHQHGVTEINANKQ